MTQKFIPILFSTEMVNAILEGRKTQTRRTRGLKSINENPDNWILDGIQLNGYFIFHNKNTGEEFFIKSPFGESGDVLWVRETFCGFLQDDKQIKYHHKGNPSFDNAVKMYWKPSINMPKEACRIFLKVSSVRVERLNDISESDAIAEGVEKIADYGTTGYKLYTEPEASYSDIDAVYSFESLWESIYGKESLDANPFVWVIEFEKIDKPQNFI